MKIYFLVILLLFFTGCSFKAEQKDTWRKNASNAFDSYSNYYLQDETTLASSSLKEAIGSAKNSANLSPLSKIYLGTCALHVAVLIDDECLEYNQIKDILKEKDSSESYYNMLQKNYDNIDLKSLPPQYSDFVKAMEKKDYRSAFKAIQTIQKTSSKLIAASLMKEHLSKKEIHYIIDEASFSGYKKAVIRWLEFLKEKSNDAEKQKIQKLLNILTQ